MMSSSSSSTTPAMAWDPKSPSSLLIALSSNGSMELNSFAAQDGIGANAVELSTLLKILSSSNYRQVLYKCVEEWENSNGDEDVSLELLKIVYAVTHLTETLILNPHPTMADAIPYLRLHHLPGIDENKYAALEECRHPEEEDEYWNILEMLILRGCTSDAWALLCHHSVCRRAFLAEDTALDDYQQYQRKIEREGFLALRAILESAPLPGGRTDYYDAGVVDEGDEEDEDRTPLLDGVSRLDYQLWTVASHSNLKAIDSFRTWKTFIESSNPLSQLQQSIPGLVPLIQILQGDFHRVSFSSWPEALLAELLYIRPNLTFSDLHSRVGAALKKFGPDTDKFAHTLLTILEGNYGRIVQVLYELGGGSGAALPATVTSLLCNLLLDAKCLPPNSENIQTDLLLDAADAILSSTTSSGLGMRLATLLLVPHCSSKRDIRITATLAEALERFSPETDADAKLILDLVEPLVKEKKSRRILDGCVSMIVSRFRHHELHSAKLAMEWLIRGIKFENYIFQFDGKEEDEYCCSVCLGLLIRQCLSTSNILLQLLLGKSKSCNPVAVAEMVNSLGDYLNLDAVRLLISLNMIVISLISEETDSAVTIATEISKILQRNKGQCLAPPAMQWDLLLLALPILNSEQKRFEAGQAANFESAFDVTGIQAMMERFLHITTIQGHEEDKLKSVDEINEALAKGLMRAFITENARRKQDKSNTMKAKGKKILVSTQIESYSSDDQEKLVEQMLSL
mmetsp:Transcript_14323/g.22074  ORF Transcript_14323/g.22074 Transcript_14323/m.22074 type:complete len:742 (-) Transcript_14323:124-2349(-)